MISLHSWLFKSEAEKLLREDLFYFEPTLEYGGVSSKNAKSKVVSRGKGVLACSEEAALIYEASGAEVLKVMESGSELNGGEVVIEAKGPAKSVFAAWRTAQSIVSYMSGVATYTRALVEKAKAVNGNVAIAATRQSPPGMRALWMKAIVVGGGIVHRLNASDEILLFKNHLSLFGAKRIGEVVAELKKKVSYKQIGVEVSRIEEAIEAIEGGATYIQFDHVPPELLRKWVERLKSQYKWVSIGVGGGITIENVEAYASAMVDVIVTSSPYRASPIDFTTVIEGIHF